MFAALANLASERPRRVLLIAGAITLVAAVLAGTVFKKLEPFGFTDPATENQRAISRLEKATGREPSPGVVLLVDARSRIRSPSGRATVARLARSLARDPDVRSVATPFRGGDRAMISKDGRAAYILGFLDKDSTYEDVEGRIQRRFRDSPGVSPGGVAVAFPQIGSQVQDDLRTAEMLAFPILLLLSFLFFRSLVAASLPLLVGGLSIIGALAALRIAAELTDLSVFAVNLITGLGLGLAIDYSLFLVSRFREEVARGHDTRDAIAVMMQTAGRTVVFSSLTVAPAMASLVIFPQRFLYSMGLGGAVVALLAALVAVTVLPAVLMLLGPRVNSVAPRWLQRSSERTVLPATQGAWYRLSRFVMKRPIPIATAASLLMILIGLPFLHAKFMLADARVLPAGSSGGHVDRVLRADFPDSRTSPVIMEIDAARAKARSPEMLGFMATVRHLPHVTAVERPRAVGGGVIRADAILDVDTESAAAQRVVRAIRDQRAYAPGPLRVAGQTAGLIDERASIAGHIPFAVGVIFLSTFVVLFLMTGSVILPVKALIMNLLTISAAFGVIVVVFQEGHLEGLLGFKSLGALDLSNPMLIFASAFGLSTDYGVFLLTRIKEARDAGLDNRPAVALGIERTGRIVTAAAVLFAVAVGAFVSSEITFIKQFGVAIPVAVLIDATIVRALLVPSLMELLGEWNWWAPGPLRRLHRRIGIDH